MLTDENKQWLIDAAKHDAEEAFADPEVSELRPKVQGWHWDMPALTVFFYGAGGSEPLMQIVAGLGALGCEHVSTVFDASGSTSPRKTDGTKWGPGEMQEAFRDPGSPDRHLVYENLVISVVDREGGFWQAFIKYTRDGGKTVWEEPQIMDNTDSSEGSVAGFVYDSMTKAMSRAPLTSMMRDMGVTSDLFGLSEDEAFVHSVCALAKMKFGLPESEKFALMFGGPESVSEEAIAIFERSMGEVTDMEVLQMDDDGELVPTAKPEEGVHQADHPLAGKHVRAKPIYDLDQLTEGAILRVDNWVDRMDKPYAGWTTRIRTGRSNHALSDYIKRGKEQLAAFVADREHQAPMPIDNEVVYVHVVDAVGKGGGRGYVVHESELGEEISDETPS